jgi:pimeloyl-ACP methyl ester carboxylesterase
MQDERSLGHLDVGSRDSRAAIVFLHGFTLDRTMWADQIAALSVHHRVLALDLPGHGASIDTCGEVSSALEVLRCLDAVGVDRAVFVGSSLGATVAIDAALERVSLVERLVLLDPVLLGAPTANLEQATLAELAQAGDLQAARARWLDRPSFQETLRHEAAARRLREMVSRYRGGHWLGHVREAWLHAPHTGKLPGIGCPMTVIVGARGGPRGTEMACEVARQSPLSRLEILDDVGHLVALERPEYLTRRLMEELATRTS